MDLAQVKQKLQQLLGREPEVEVTTRGAYICQFLDIRMSPKKLVSDTEEGAFRNLLAYLESRKEPS